MTFTETMDHVAFGVEFVGVSCEYGAIASDAGLAPFMRSSTISRRTSNAPA